MKHLCTRFSILLFFIFNTWQTNAQLINGNVFLQQNRVEVGIANNGAYGTTENSPTGYHSNNNPSFATIYNPATSTYQLRPNALGFVADYDTNGWTIGTPPYIGDYFLPGTPQEGWSVEVNGVRCNAFCSEYNTNGTTGFVGPLTGVNQSFSPAGGIHTSTWQGNMGALQITQTTVLKKDKLFFTGYVRLKNTGTSILSNVYYMRTVDPDNDVSTTGNFTTINEIVNVIPNSENNTLIGCTSTVDTNAYLGLASSDCRAKPFLCNFGLFPPTDTLSYLYSGLHPDLTYTGTLTLDIGVGIVYHVGDIAPGDSTEINYTYILSKNFLADALSDFKPKISFNGNYFAAGDTLLACTNSIVPLSIINAGGSNWNWASTAPLGSPSGVNNTVSLGTTPILVTVTEIGNCPDTLTFIIAPTNLINVAITADVCVPGGYTFNGVTYTATGTYNDTVFSSSGCDSNVTINAISGSSFSSSFNANICAGDTYLFNGSTYTLSGNYTATFSSVAGCDSIVTLALNVSPSNIINLNQMICIGATYTFNGVPLTLAGVYIDSFLNSIGCDSIVTLNLQVQLFNTNVTTTGNTLFSSSTGVNYQWLNCSTGMTPIFGATNNSFSPAIGGLYAVALSAAGCADTSNCILYEPIGVLEIESSSNMKIYPNPVDDICTIELSEATTIQLFNAVGEMVFQRSMSKGKHLLDMQHLPSGIYILKAMESKDVYIKEVIKR